MKIQSPYHLAWSWPCTNLGWSELTSVFRATTYPCQISSR